MNDRDFLLWFAECAIICASEHIGPDDYVWNLTDCQEWRDRFDAGLSEREAVQSKFEAH